MTNPQPRPEGQGAPSDEALAEAAKRGDAAAVETLIERHRRWVYNLALRMVHSPEDAADVTQEAFLKVLTRLSTFEGRSAFRTWLHRIVVHHVINMKARPIESMVTTFSNYGTALDAVPDLDPPDDRSSPVDAGLLVEEAKISCMMGMLLCLERSQRALYVLGELFGVSSGQGAELMGLSPDNFRQKLSRARRDLRQFMDGKCGLVNTANPCRCARKTRGFVEQGIVDPDRLVFTAGHLETVREAAPARSAELDAAGDEYASHFLSHPYANGPSAAELTRKLIARDGMGEIFEL